VSYPLHLINGRAGKERQTISAKPGQRIRFRVINAASDTAYKFAIGGHRMQVTHSDGFAVEPVNVDALRIGMGERYDVVVVAGSGAFTIAAVPEAKSDPIAEAVLRTTTTAVVPNVGLRPRELSGRVLAYRDLVPAESSRLPTRQPSRSATITLTQATSGYSQGIDGATYPNAAPLLVHEGERLRVKIVNATMMFHPMHLHGHSFQVVGSTRKDTVAVPSMGAVEIDIEADNPGQWMLHCHNTYHFETGMATLLSYRH
jgi:multicopper oxidase